MVTTATSAVAATTAVAMPAADSRLMRFAGALVDPGLLSIEPYPDIFRDVPVGEWVYLY